LDEYVTPRVHRVNQLTNLNDWYYTPTEHNPADVILRDLSSRFLINANQLWFTRPPIEVLLEAEKQAIALTHTTAVAELDPNKADTLWEHSTTSMSFRTLRWLHQRHQYPLALFDHPITRSYGNRTIQTVVSQCFTCRRYRTGKLFVPQIAPLPPDKVTTDIAFKVIWTFQPSATPWWGTLWKRLIGSIKHAMDRISLTACTTYEQLATMMHKVQGFVNSRPRLCSCHTTPLTLAHRIF